ncbi:hypothetical protein SAMN02745248_01211 [Hathewaya proteolytica DSM 3090]|uniref:Uncharacterized protein n=1 Tax=Hathewaya proteolytica DSM 3090 TaxID=1121331 RepID=A0A1M6MX03_9CLOT|nr:hypothetical protein [Hathewaya proteolytica]SHJ88005.1 hypothetical protein SAMN02745248_01211 [Hathewaya proteolytica DSM 3090]
MIDLKRIYKQVRNTIENVNFSDLWPGFKRFDFALYNDDIVILDGQLVPKTDDFLGNTSILYDGKYIAIWRLTTEIDKYVLASKIIHEMFHAYQMEMHESRFPNEIEALWQYKYSPDYLQIKYEENLLLAELTVEFNTEKLKSFLQYRKFRQCNYTYEYNYENSVEAIEGSATYVELQALKMFNEEKYLQRLHGMLDNISNLGNLIPMRIICYDTGALFLNLCMENSLSLDLTVGIASEIFYSKLIEDTACKNISIKVSPEIKKFYQEDQRNFRKKIELITSHCNEVIKGNFELLGVNVYSARFLDGYIYSEYFIMYKDAEPKILYGDYLAKIENHMITEIYKEP